MDELIKLVVQKTGIPQDKAQMAVDTVLKFLKSKLPPAIGGQLDAVISGKSLPGDITKGLEGLLGGKKK